MPPPRHALFAPRAGRIFYFHFQTARRAAALLVCLHKCEQNRGRCPNCAGEHRRCEKFSLKYDKIPHKPVKSFAFLREVGSCRYRCFDALDLTRCTCCMAAWTHTSAFPRNNRQYKPYSYKRDSQAPQAGICAASRPREFLYLLSALKINLQADRS